MGRWSQAHRSGGGISLNFIVYANEVTINVIELNYLTANGLSALATTDFTTSPGGFQPDSILDSGGAAQELTFSEDIDSETSITYAGNAPSVLSPQTFPVGH